ncbi:Hypothetical protein PFREUD_10100 [Propionibacterium freudenreichii subsp. shermanii CIRM-BIA1]|uniref:Uncharacterized protein n=1 Tax=Propionibacterium freudenreichii subsp. shermanii (strain ATCC 9614 / DSM 4902 / CIP 103027 / NCIMB 8099 / CIRM-BIA1) TaxID=754252 RepID=D7GDC3_PROFC|nr:Hypothetical protein PFREUD_10100 [Propionibacterium freudenreichii subsp. shermanii CIRM-BIA1]
MVRVRAALNTRVRWTT